MIPQKKNQLVTRNDGDLDILMACDIAFEKIDLNYFINLLVYLVLIRDEVTYKCYVALFTVDFMIL